jgi:hypothetical protein
MYRREKSIESINADTEGILTGGQRRMEKVCVIG